MKILNFPPHRVYLAEAAPATLDANWFEPAWLREQGWVTGSSDSSGRNPAWFFQQDDRRYVLRHYWRGGLPGKLFKDGYLYLGEQRSRPWQELSLMVALKAKGLPVATPVAARLTRTGLNYRADLLTEMLPQSQDMVKHLSGGAMAAVRWQALGSVLARFHREGVYHADLNARNILLSQGEFFLIDFDRGELRNPATDWQQANLARLRRSLLKEQGRVAGLHYDDAADWAALMAGYNSELASAN
ncbi:3-deoxy-D-manno-octulosonic acid kinase [Ferrimonas balearica]|uniref:3-deoxy-D-manno-octulosonic acid kinase n=1 Tax=Ferrimonas balearica TaxID=44012 RepID=UPI001C94BFBB|nr:3-deoxy-D-manno-octulosonic acid kinase [Ferrimonas balearica]MBY6225617.1 3-deoxy-D-manno-octulosonic acid kinase [Ferrimonas balearica]